MRAAVRRRRGHGAVRADRPALAGRRTLLALADGGRHGRVDRGPGVLVVVPDLSDTPLPSPSMADVGYLTLPVFALPALLTFDVAPTRVASPSRVARPRHLPARRRHRGRPLFVLTWATALGAVVHAGSPNLPAFAVAIAYPLTDLVLVAIVVLLVATRRAPRPLRPAAVAARLGPRRHLGVRQHLRLPGQQRRRRHAPGHQRRLHRRSAADRGGRPGHGRRPAGPAARPPAAPPTDRAHLLLPYVLVAITGTVVALQSALGDGIDTVETALIWIVLVLVLARQVVTLLENAVLLDRLSGVAGRAQPPGAPRPADRAGQPGAVQRPAAGGDRPPRAPRPALRRARDRPRRLQAGQRPARARRRRPPALRRRPAAAGHACAASTPSPASAATSSPSCWPTARRGCGERGRAGPRRPAAPVRAWRATRSRSGPASAWSSPAPTSRA